MASNIVNDTHTHTHDSICLHVHGERHAHTPKLLVHVHGEQQNAQTAVVRACAWRTTLTHTEIKNVRVWASDNHKQKHT